MEIRLAVGAGALVLVLVAMILMRGARIKALR